MVLFVHSWQKDIRGFIRAFAAKDIRGFIRAFAAEDIRGFIRAFVAKDIRGFIRAFAANDILGLFLHSRQKIFVGFIRAFVAKDILSFLAKKLKAKLRRALLPHGAPVYLYRQSLYYAGVI
ncbi:MAG: hypothetical protein ABIN67_06620 [Ferruginibacter sp.]